MNHCSPRTPTRDEIAQQVETDTLVGVAQAIRAAAKKLREAISDHEMSAPFGFGEFSWLDFIEQLEGVVGATDNEIERSVTALVEQRFTLNTACGREYAAELRREETV